MAYTIEHQKTMNT